jgi:hypothetical protein
MNTGTASQKARASGSWSGFAVLLGMVAVLAGPAEAQQITAGPSTGPLPEIIYPSRAAKAARSEPGPPTIAPEPACDPDDDCQIRYVIVGGFWGYWDRNRHFHRVSAAPVRAMRSRTVAYHGVSVAHSGSVGGGRAHR